jgi:hypothetical protein
MEKMTLKEWVANIKTKEMLLKNEDDKLSKRMTVTSGLLIVSTLAVPTLHPLFIVGTIIGGAGMIKIVLDGARLQERKGEINPKIRLIRRRGPFTLKRDLPHS